MKRPTAQSVVERLTERLNAPKPIPLEQVRGYYRYLTHKDNPEKAQYDEKDIQTLNGFDIRDFVEMTKSEVNAKIRIIQKMIRELDFLSMPICWIISRMKTSWQMSMMLQSITQFFEHVY